MAAPFKAECPHCFTTFNLKSRASAGKKVKCKSCGEPFVVKLVGDSAPADDFEDDIEDYGDVEEYGDVPASAGALPPTRSSRPQPAKKKKKRKGGSSFPMKPLVIGLVVLAVGVGGWFGIGMLPSGGLLTMFDTPEGLLDKFIATQYDLMDTLSQVESPDDMEWLKGKVDGYSARIKDLNKRMILLAPVSEERAKEVAKYSSELRDIHQDKLKERSKVEMERLRGLNLLNSEFSEAVSGMIGTSFSMDHIKPTPEPRERFPVENYLAELDVLQRKTAQVLIQMDDLSSAKSRLSDVKELTAEFKKLKEHENIGKASPGSPYFSRGVSWSVLIAFLSSDVREASNNDEGIAQVLIELSAAMSELDIAAMNRGPGGPTGGPRPGFNPSRPGNRPGGFPSQGSNQSSGSPSVNTPSGGKLRPLGLAMHNYHDAHKSFPGKDRDADGNIGLSWRVHVLPFLDEASLHKQFDLNSDWNSAQNRELRSKRPDSLKASYDVGPVMSSFHVFEGQGTPFGSLPLPRLRDIKDGSSNTIMIIRGGRGTAKPWTMPGGLPFDRNAPKQNLGQAPGGNYLALMFDGSVRPIPANIDDQQFANMIQHEDASPGR